MAFKKLIQGFSEIRLRKSHLKTEIKNNLGTDSLDVFNNAAAGWIGSVGGFVSLPSHFPAVLGKQTPLLSAWTTAGHKCMFIFAEEKKK